MVNSNQYQYEIVQQWYPISMSQSTAMHGQQAELLQALKRLSVFEALKRLSVFETLKRLSDFETLKRLSDCRRSKD